MKPVCLCEIAESHGECRFRDRKARGGLDPEAEVFLTFAYPRILGVWIISPLIGSALLCCLVLV